LVTEGFAVMKCPHCQENIGIYYVISLKKNGAVSDTLFTCPHCGKSVTFVVSEVTVDKFSGF